MNYEKLIEFAEKARLNAYAPYSGFKVGAALLCDDGEVFVGCNVENAAYSATNCAERTAIFSAVAAGKRKFVAIAIVGGKGDRASDTCLPCGVCRQVLTEFCPGDFKIVTGCESDVRVYTLSQLLPLAFNSDSLSDEQLRISENEVNHRK